ncbi:tetratricopeptide repeat protein [Paucibacter sp. APW11]|uniref:Tetratricopeptide repeat protein n=1 Tax=Roseateles aquae TaxID=3077235 RepID=A0ABU3PB61_9BURK|nr:tetratricopeptide repeat protein [Paucibacter sp. APW11]MDT8999804.1 tetratricopeptide repeat protein [Paucibacter sp. APW11]
MRQTTALRPAALAVHAALAALLCSALAQAAPASTAKPLDIDAAITAYAEGQPALAAQAFARLARQGDALAQYNLAMMHLRGELPRASVREAKRLLERAAAGKLIRAELALAQFHEQGLSGRVDSAAAMRWYRLAAEHGSADAQLALGTAHYLGRGAALDMSEAAHWYREAAKAGDVGAQYLIASMYESGLGVSQDLRLARYWYDIAARNGDEAAPFKRQELDAKLTPADT